MKTRQIEGLATIVRTGSSCVGSMAWETPYCIIAINGERFRYQSDNVEILELDKDDMISCKMRVRDNGRVWRFTLNKKYTV